MENKNGFKEERDKIVRGLEETYRKLVVAKKRNNSSMIVYKDGKIVELSPDELLPTTVYRRRES